MKLYTDTTKKYPGYINAAKIQIAAKYASVDVTVASDFTYNASTQKSADFLKKSPLGKIPVLETPEGYLFEASAAARYGKRIVRVETLIGTVARLSKNALYGANPFEAGLVDQWIDFALNEIDLPASVWVFPILGYIDGGNQLATQKAKGDIRNILDVLNKHLTTRTYLVGHRITLADISVALSLYNLYERVLDPGFRKGFPHVNRWFLTLVNQDNFKAVLGDTKLCEKMEVAKEAAKGAEKKKEEKPKKEAKKEEPKKEQPKKEGKPAAEEAEEEEKPAEPKAKNPLDLLPPSKFILDDWKRMYSNNDTLTVAIPWFWENLDKEGYSVWFADYKYNDELEKMFMTCNLVGGFLQRVERLRKYGFGSVVIFGEEPKLAIGSCWLFRGQDIPNEMKECDDSEHYNWKKADLNSEQDRKLINAYWAWEGFEDKKFGAGKIFK